MKKAAKKVTNAVDWAAAFRGEEAEREQEEEAAKKDEQEHIEQIGDDEAKAGPVVVPPHS